VIVMTPNMTIRIWPPYWYVKPYRRFVVSQWRNMPHWASLSQVSQVCFSQPSNHVCWFYTPPFYHMSIYICWLYHHWISPVPSPAPSAHLGLVGARASFRFGFPGKALYGVLLQVLIGAQWTNFMGFWMGCWWFSWDVYWICMGVV